MENKFTRGLEETRIKVRASQTVFFGKWLIIPVFSILLFASTILPIEASRKFSDILSLIALTDLLVCSIILIALRNLVDLLSINKVVVMNIVLILVAVVMATHIGFGEYVEIYVAALIAFCFLFTFIVIFAYALKLSRTGIFDEINEDMKRNIENKWRNL